MTTLLLGLGLALALALPQAQETASRQRRPEVQERVTVERVVITGRVIDRFANPILGLTTGDFRLRVDGRGAAIETVEWIPGEGNRKRKLRLLQILPNQARTSPYQCYESEPSGAPDAPRPAIRGLLSGAESPESQMEA
jgi:hypothetical protein